MKKKKKIKVRQATKSDRQELFEIYGDPIDEDIGMNDLLYKFFYTKKKTKLMLTIEDSKIINCFEE